MMKTLSNALREAADAIEQRPRLRVEDLDALVLPHGCQLFSFGPGRRGWILSRGDTAAFDPIARVLGRTPCEALLSLANAPAGGQSLGLEDEKPGDIPHEIVDISHSGSDSGDLADVLVVATVLLPDGSPVEGAVVVSSAGGQGGRGCRAALPRHRKKLLQMRKRGCTCGRDRTQ